MLKRWFLIYKGFLKKSPEKSPLKIDVFLFYKMRGIVEKLFKTEKSPKIAKSHQKSPYIFQSSWE